MKSYFEDERTTLYQGDAREVLRTLEAGSVQTVVTSPPYWGLRDYKTPGQIGLEPTPEEYVATVVVVFREVRRVLRDDGTVWLNLGDSYAATDKTTGRNDSETRNAWQAKVGIERNPARANDGGGSIRVAQSHGLKPKDLIGIPWRVAFALQSDGWWLRSDIIWSKPNPMPESVQDRPTRSHEYVFLLSKRERYFYDADAIREPHVDWREGSNMAVAVHSVKDTTISDNGVHKWNPKANAYNPAGRNKRSVWEIATQPYAAAHFATFPEALVRPCILAGTSERGQCNECGAPWERVTERDGVKHRTAWGTLSKEAQAAGNSSGHHGPTYSPVIEWEGKKTIGWAPTCDCHDTWTEPVPQVVLDPFSGSGTVGVVARKAGRKAVLIDLSPEYCQLAADRFRQAVLL